jgi:hypothetical protein
VGGHQGTGAISKGQLQENNSHSKSQASTACFTTPLNGSGWNCLYYIQQSESVLKFLNAPNWEYSELIVSLGLFYSHYAILKIPELTQLVISGL